MSSQSQHKRDIKEWIKKHSLNLQEEDILFLIYDAIDNSIGAIIITDLKGRIIYVNKVFPQIFCIDRESVIDESILSIFLSPHDSDLFSLVEQIEKNNQCQLRRFDNSVFYALTITSQVENLQGEQSAVIFSLIDITTQKELERSQKVLIEKLEESQKKLASMNKLLEQISLEDKLTGLANRRAFDLSFDLEWRRAKRDETPLSLLMIDVDNFKAYNDHYGHQQGDHCLKFIADTMLESGIANRAGDIIARYGGEEFVVVLTHTSNKNAFSLAERLVENIRNKGILHNSNNSGVVTISVGVATVETFGAMAKEDLIEEADKALYVAKDSGKSCVR